MIYTKEMRVKDTANKLVDRLDLDGAIIHAERTWKKYVGAKDTVSQDHRDFYSEVWWYLVERADGKTLAKLFSSDTLAQIAVAKSMREIA